MSWCVMPQYRDLSEEFLNSYCEKEISNDRFGVLGLKDVFISSGLALPLETKRYMIFKEHPTKYNTLYRCSYRCCGSCSRRCLKRCPQDVLIRLDTMRKGGYGAKYKKLATIELSRRPTSYKRLCLLISETLKEDNSRMYYGAVRVIENDQAIVDSQTGAVKVVEWPDSGLCPFCLSDRNTIRRSRGLSDLVDS